MSLISIIFNRILASVFIPTVHDWFIASLALLVYTAIALPFGFSTGFLQLQIYATKPINYFFLILRCLLTPAITEEFVFRVFFLPHATEVVKRSHDHFFLLKKFSWVPVNSQKWILWAALSLLMFIIYHPLNAKTFYRDGYPTFVEPIFLILATLLGLTCTITYALTSSAWIIIFIHWLVVVLWLLIFGGMDKLDANQKLKVYRDSQR
ncbi:MAG: CPBP family glutamic-type intramembrane protease [Cyanobacteria bacterium P01_D01_bin.50]